VKAQHPVGVVAVFNGRQKQVVVWRAMPWLLWPPLLQLLLSPP
jgi:hypothetical protein